MVELPIAVPVILAGVRTAVVMNIGVMTIAATIGAGGLGDFALRLGYQRFNDEVTWAAVAVIIVLVQTVQFVGNAMARRIMRR